LEASGTADLAPAFNHLREFLCCISGAPRNPKSTETQITSSKLTFIIFIDKEMTMSLFHL